MIASFTRSLIAIAALAGLAVFAPSTLAMSVVTTGYSNYGPGSSNGTTINVVVPATAAMGDGFLIVAPGGLRRQWQVPASRFERNPQQHRVDRRERPRHQPCHPRHHACQPCDAGTGLPDPKRDAERHPGERIDRFHIHPRPQRRPDRLQSLHGSRHVSSGA